MIEQLDNYILLCKYYNVRQLVVGPLCALLVDWYREAVVALGRYSGVETSAGPD